MKFFILFLLSLEAFAGVPVDIVFDIDLTIVALVKDGPGGDLLADPALPDKGIVDIGYHNERYRVFEGVRELLEKLKKDPRVRVSFFSGGQEARNEALLKKIKLQDGSSLWDLAQGRVLGRLSMTPTGLPSPARIRERFKKDLTKINPDLSDVIIIDDIKEFVPSSQRPNLLWIGEDFPFPDRTKNPPASVHPTLLQQEKNKYQWISRHLDHVLHLRFTEGRPLSETLQDISIKGHRCGPDLILDRLLIQ
jgi:hypothetical protein